MHPTCRAAAAALSAEQTIKIWLRVPSITSGRTPGSTRRKALDVMVSHENCKTQLLLKEP
jgi:hypothetical protein